MSSTCVHDMTSTNPGACGGVIISSEVLSIYVVVTGMLSTNASHEGLNYLHRLSFDLHWSNLFWEKSFDINRHDDEGTENCRFRPANYRAIL